MTIPAVQKAVSEGKANQTRGSPEAEGKASREISDLFTNTQEYQNRVTWNDKRTFARSLANKTMGMADGEHRTIYIFGYDKIYCFNANGYMQGNIEYIVSADKYKSKGESIEEYGENRVDDDRKIADLWSQAVQNEYGRYKSDSDFLGERGTTNTDDSLLADPLERYTSRYTERERENFETSEEAREILSKLKELAENLKQGKASREIDTAYLDAVKSGDMETAQKMVDEAAKILARTRAHGVRPYGFWGQI